MIVCNDDAFHFSLHEKLKRRIYVSCVIAIGFICGIHYWYIFVRLHCLSTEIKKTSQANIKFYEHFHYRTRETCQNRDSQRFLTIAIISSSYKRLIVNLSSIISTWFLTGTFEVEIIIFIDEFSIETEDLLRDIFFQLNSNKYQLIKSCLYIVKLKNVQNSHPSQKKSFYVLKYLYAFYRHRTSWLLRLDDNAYVNLDKLIPWLKSIDSQRALYIGQNDSGERNGSTIDAPSEHHFCMGSSGIIISQTTLIELGPWLDECLHNERLTQYEDVELGRCILKYVNVSCSRSDDLKKLFYYHYGPQYLFGYDYTPSILSHAFIISPINDRNTFLQIFYFYLREKQTRSLLNNKREYRKRKFNEPYVTFLPRIELHFNTDLSFPMIDPRWKSYIENIIEYHIDNIAKVQKKTYNNLTAIQGNFLSGYYRVIPKMGLDIIIEMKIKFHSIFSSSNTTVTLQERVHVYQSFANENSLEYREIQNMEVNDDKNQLNLVVVSSHRDEALIRFLYNFKREVIDYSNRDKYYTLTILYFTRTNNPITNFINTFARENISIIRLKVIDENQTIYNRGFGRQLASNLFAKDQLLLFLDVDIMFTRKALDNIRKFMIHQLSSTSCKVYFPVIFSGFSNLLSRTYQSMFDVNSNTGSFSIHGFGNVAVRKSDLDRIGGWETNNYEWGLEDVHLFRRFSNPTSECYVFRSTEPELQHYYHKKSCTGITNNVKRKMCNNAENILLASQRDMVDYLSNNTEIIVF